MAQFFQVLSQSGKNLEESGQFYQEGDESQTVQYVIAPEEHQQQVVVASEQLMVVDGQQQQVIIEPNQVAYQTPSYIIQDSPRATFHGNRQQQVYYMSNSSPRQLVVEQQQPVVLNHQMMQNLPAKVVSQPMAALPNQMQQVRTATAMRAVQQRPALARTLAQQQQQQAKVIPSPTTLQALPKKGVEERAERKAEDFVTLADGTFMRLQEYQKLLAHQKQSVELTENSRIVSPVVTSTALHPTQHHQMAGKKAPVRNPNPRPRVRAPKLPLRTRDGKLLGNVSSPHAQQKTQSPFSAQQQQQQLSLKQKSQQQQYQGPQSRPQLYRQLPSPSQAPSQQPQNQYIIQPPRAQMKQQQKPLPPFLHSSQIQHIIDNTPMNDEYSDSIRMLVLLDNGEQRLITFTLPKEACTIQEILEQVNVPFQHDTPIQVTEANANGINYVVAVGHVPGMNTTQSPEEECSTPEASPVKQPPTPVEPEAVVGLAKPPSPDPTPKELPIRRVEGRLAVCQHCGYLSEDFNRCLRCKKVLPETPKAVPNDAANAANGQKLNPKLLNEKKFALPKPNGTPKLNLLAKPKVRAVRQPKVLESDTVYTLSSDEEDGGAPKSKNVNEQLLEKLGSSVTLSPISKEPSIVDIQKTSLLATSKVIEKIASDQVCSTEIHCRTVRIGSYRFVSPGPVLVNSTGVVIRVPHPRSENTIKVITVEKCDIVKVLISYQKSLPVLFYYLSPAVGVRVRTILDMCQGGEYYFDPLSESEESYRRITLLPDVIPDETKSIIQKIYSQQSNVLEELSYKEANDILIKTCPKEITKSIISSYSNMNEVKCLLLYPPEGRFRLSINTEDYMCLGHENFLNDVIIDFYSEYLKANLPQEEQEKVHVFSTFFYKRLTMKPPPAPRKSQNSDADANLSAAQKRHARVKTWTKGVNIFEKDFIIVPINENSHWFLAIICFPNMDGTHTMDGKPIIIEPRRRQKKAVSIGSGVTVTPVKREVEPSIACGDGELSDKDEAEGDESELESDDSEEATQVVEHSKKPPIKQPCILIFDSLSGASRTRVVATLRDYLTCEYKVKMNAEKTFTKDVIKGACPKVPQQSNFTDCGLYVLQYIEQFFKDPIKDYHMPITHLKTWFEEIVVTRKREEIALLIMSLMKESGRDLSMIPTDVEFPTLNGEVVERPDKFAELHECDEEIEEEDDDDEEYVPLPPPPQPKKKRAKASSSNDSESEKSCESPVKSRKDIIEEDVLTNVIKSDNSEFKKATSNKDTLSYLKAKRIIRHKNISGDGPDPKKARVAAD